MEDQNNEGQSQTATVVNPIIAEMQKELEAIDATQFPHAHRSLTEEMERIEKGRNHMDILNDKRKTKITGKIHIPVKEFPKANFVGKLLGPKGNTLKRLQEETGTKMSILGKGSMKDKQKEEELRAEGSGKYAHLHEDQHVLVEVFSTPVDAYNRMAYACMELKKYLSPEFNEEIRQEQMQEMMSMDTNGSGPVGRGRGRGGPRGAGRGAGRGAPAGLLSSPTSRGMGRAAPPSRGAPAPRGTSRGAPRGTLARGASRGAAAVRGYDDYGAGYDEGYGATDTYGAQDAYDTGYGGGRLAPANDYGDTQSFDYGHGSYGGGAGTTRRAAPAYDDGYGDSWGSGGRGYKAPSARGGSVRSHPYASGRGGY